MRHNKSKKWQRVCASLLTIALVATMLPVGAFAADGAQAERPSLSGLPDWQTMDELLQSSLKKLEGTPHAEDDEVTFIVQMSEKPVIEANVRNIRLETFLESGTGKATIARIQSEQQRAISAVQSQFGGEMEVQYRYNTVFNGFSVNTTYGHKADLEKLPGVKSVSVARTYEYQSPEDGYEPVAVSSGELIHSDEANDLGYTGKGTLTAILDSGLYDEHEAFKKAPADPALTQESLKTLVDSIETSGNGLQAEADVDQLWHSDKVPFAYDYAEHKFDVSKGDSHGTHVSGTVGADGEKFKGVAPDTQIVFLKVFNDQNSGATTAVIMAALEDAVSLGVDTINMSLGTASGFSESSLEAEATAYQNVEKAGINLMCAAGNDYSASYNGPLGVNLAPVENPDNGIVGSPSSYKEAVSVASVNEKISRENYLSDTTNDRHIPYYDNGSADAADWGKLDGTYKYVVLNNVGYPTDFDVAKQANGGTLDNTIVVIPRGTIAFTEKEQNAYDAGALAVIVYDNDPNATDPWYMRLNGLLPMVGIRYEDGQYLKNLEKKELSISLDQIDEITPDNGELMSDFSSLGVAPDMSLKPEITAPGGTVWSTLPNNRYGSYDGTSMASPHMAGAASVVRQYVNENPKFASLTDAEKRDVINDLLLSTATQVLDADKVAYTPRKQGAGLANVLGAVTTSAYLTVNGGRPKAELKDNADGKFTFTFKVHNFGDTEKKYDVSVVPLVAKTVHDDTLDRDFISENSEILGSDKLTVTVQDSVTVPAANGEEGVTEVTVTLELTEAGKEALKVFPNGIFLDGFVQLKDTSEGGVDLSLPYIGFYGDWSKVPVFDKTVFDDEDAAMYETQLLALYEDWTGSLYGAPLGVNLFLTDEEGNPTDDFETEKTVFGYYGDQMYQLAAATGLLRAPERMTYSVSKEDGSTLVELAEATDVMKSFYYANGDYILYDLLPYGYGFTKYGEDYTPYPDGKYSFDQEAQIAGTEKTQTLSIPFKIDSTEPTIEPLTQDDFFTKREVSAVTGEEEDVPYVRVKVKDENGFIMGVQLIGATSTEALSDIYTDETVTTPGETYTFEIPLDIAQFLGMIYGDDAFQIVVLDYGMYETDSTPLPLSGENAVTEVRFNTKLGSASVDSQPWIAEAYVDPQSVTDKSIDFSTDTPELIDLTPLESREDETGTHIERVQVTFKKAGTARLTATSHLTPEVSTTIELPIAPVPIKPNEGGNWDGVIPESGIYELPPDWSTPITITCSNDKEGTPHNVTLISAPAKTDILGSKPYWYSSPITVETTDGEGVALTIRDMHMTAGSDSAIAFTGGENTLTFENENVINVTGDGAGIEVPYGTSLRVTNTGTQDKLTVNMQPADEWRPVQGAGIGGKYPSGPSYSSPDTDFIAGGITLDPNSSGTITLNAKGNVAGALVGGCYYGIASQITMNNGTVNIDVQKTEGFQGHSYGAAAIGSGSSMGGGSVNKTFSDKTQTITINGGTIRGTTNADGALIGTGTKSSGYNSDFFTADIEIKGGDIELTGSDEDHYAGALIGSGNGMPCPNITIDGGRITATQTTSLSAAAIGSGTAGYMLTFDPGNITINGGTVTALLPEGAQAHAIGSSSANSPASVEINNGTVKTRAESAEAPSDTPSVDDPTNAAGNALHEVKVPALKKENEGENNGNQDEEIGLSGLIVAKASDPAFKDTTDDSGETVHTGEPYGDEVSVAGLHPDDDSLYLWLPEGEFTVKTRDTLNDWTYTDVTVDAEGKATLANVYEFGVYPVYLTPADPTPDDSVEDFLDIGTDPDFFDAHTYVYRSYVREGEAFSVTLVPDPGYTVPLEDEVYVYSDGLMTFNYTYDADTGTVTVQNIEGDTYISAYGAIDASELYALLQEAAKLKQDDYTPESWADFQAAYDNGWSIYNEVLNPLISPSPDTIQGAIDALRDAMDNLVPLHDTTGLDEAIATAESLSESDYTKESWAALQAALAPAKETAGNPDATQSEINAAEQALREALDALESVADKGELAKQIASAQALNEDDYTSESWAALEDALQKALAVNEDEKAVQSDVDAAAQALADAIAALVERGDKTALNDAIASAEALNADDYTTESWAALQEALTEAKAVRDNADATQEQVDAAKEALDAAVSALKKAVDKSALDAAIAQAEALNSEDYTIDSRSALQEALTEAKAVRDNADATQEQVDAAAKALTDALNALKKLEAGNVDGTGDIDISDALSLFVVASGQAKADDLILAYGDVNGDGQINLSDAYLVYLAAAGRKI